MKKLLKRSYGIFKLFLGLSLLFFSLDLSAQQVSGMVKDSEGAPIVGAAILVKGTNNGTTTDNNGGFTLNNVPKGATLSISFVGFKTQETNADGSNLTIVLQEGESLDELIVTGVFDTRTRMESSVAISTLDSKEMSRLVPNSAADFLKNTPGVYVNSSAGEIRNSVYSRGISANSNASIVGGVNGYYYVSLQEDGLPVIAVSSAGLAADIFYRADASVKRLEAVRGGSSSITSVNAPGGIFNFLSKNGSEKENEVRVRVGLEGNGKNPFYRADLTYGGAVGSSDSLFYNIGGFYRKADGARYAGYPLNDGGQLKANLTKNYSKGSIRFFAKYLNDKNANTMTTPASGFDKITLAPGVKFEDSYLLPAGELQIPNGKGGTVSFDPSSATHIKDFSAGFNLKHDLNDTWSISNNAKFSNKNLLVNTNAATSFTYLNDATTYFFMGALGGPGSINLPGVLSFKDRATGSVVATVQQNLSQTGPPSWVVTNSKLPAAVNNAILYSGSTLTQTSVDEFMNQFTINKKLKNGAINAGVFYSKSNIASDPNMPAAVLSLSMIQDKPQPLDVSMQAVNGKTYQISDPKTGYVKLGGSFGYGTYDFDVSQLAFFLGNNLTFAEKLNIDWGIRYENTGVSGENQRSVINPKNPTGGLDGNPLTVYDNFSAVLGQNNVSFDKNLAGFSFSVGANYKIDKNNALYVRYANGKKAPDLSFYESTYTSKFAVDNSPLLNQEVVQIEAAYKTRMDNFKATITPFYSQLSNIATTALTTDANNQFYYPDPLFNAVKTTGVEVELDWSVAKNFNLAGAITLQNAKYKVWKLWNVGAMGKQDDKIEDYTGGRAENNPSAMVTLTPSYTTDKFYALLQYKYMGNRAANQSNAYDIPAFSQLDLGLGYNISKKFSLSFNINNLTNKFGVMASYSPGSIIQVFQPNSVTKATITADPNAVHPVVAIQPRAYFLTASYKF